ncbi:MAG: stage V sporulation protein S [Chloroflexota bacterium]
MAELIKVSAQSRSTSVAGAIAGVMREQGYAEVQAIGASAVNQAIKAIAIARGYLEQDNIDLTIIPSFTEVDIEGNERTAVRMSVYRRSPGEDLVYSNGLDTMNLGFSEMLFRD